MNQDQQDPIENLLDGLSQHSSYLSQEDRKAELRAKGVDVDGFLSEAHSIIAHYQKEDRLAWMKVADAKETAFKGGESRIESWLGKPEVLIKAAFESWIRTAMPQEALAFRNKTDLTVDDMARILDDHERLKLRSGSPKPPDAK
jgi:hypothetical protein